jgi:hypothetical protein
MNKIINNKKNIAQIKKYEMYKFKMVTTMTVKS